VVIIKTFETKDMYFAASIISYGMQLVGSEKMNGLIYFKINITDQQLLDKLNMDFDTCNLYVNVKRFSKALSEVRNELDKHR
jgi:hypothetical protein